MNALEVKEDGQIYLDDGQQLILVSNQDVAQQYLRLHEAKAFEASTDNWPDFTLKPGIYPIPDLKWEPRTVEKFYESKGWFWEKVAAISLPLESTPSTEQIIDDINGLVIYQGDGDYPSIEEESQENLLQEIFDLCQQDEWHRILSKFTITRKQ